MKAGNRSFFLPVFLISKSIAVGSHAQRPNDSAVSNPEKSGESCLKSLQQLVGLVAADQLRWRLAGTLSRMGFGGIVLHLQVPQSGFGRVDEDIGGGAMLLFMVQCDQCGTVLPGGGHVKSVCAA